jgi:hypothetical protein
VRNKELEDFCRTIYRETSEHEAIVAAREQYNLGFEILMGPPRLNPDIAFIGYQPGEWAMSVTEARTAGYEDWWVHGTCQYATAKWKLAVRLRTMFTAEGLESCVGLNAIFVRARSIAEYQRVPVELRNRIRTFCLAQVDRMLRAMEPKKIVVIGFETMRLFGRAHPCDVSAGKVLVRAGYVFQRRAFATPHLSAAWGLRKEDLTRIARFVLA